MQRAEVLWESLPLGYDLTEFGSPAAVDYPTTGLLDSIARSVADLGAQES